MLSKKPIQGWKCATCETDLVGMEGMPAQYHNWKKMPQGEKKEITGPGYSKLLNHLHSEYPVNMSMLDLT